MWPLLVACQDPFGTDRHDLVGFRIAAVSVPPGDDLVTPRVAVITDGRAWSAQPADLAWYWVSHPDDVAAIDALTEADATGPTPLLTVPSGPRVLALIARGDGEERRAFVEVARPPDALEGPTGFVLEALPLAVRTVDGADLAPDARARLRGEAAAWIEPGGFARLRASSDGLVRWMATSGTFFELDGVTTDWAAGEVILDGDTVEEPRRILREGATTVLALSLGAPGETAFRATEVHVGEPGPGLWVAGRWLPTDLAVTAIEGQTFRGTLVADDDSPVGLRLVDPVPEPTPAAFGTEALPCLVPRSGPFDPGWLLEQICGRDALVDASVVVRVSP